MLGMGYRVSRGCLILCGHAIDVSNRAGTCILQEAGGFVYPAQLPEGFKDDGHQELPGADLGGRLYLAVRPCCSTEDETARQAQDRVARQVWRRVERMDYYRPA